MVKDTETSKTDPTLEKSRARSAQIPDGDGKLKTKRTQITSQGNPWADSSDKAPNDAPVQDRHKQTTVR